MFEDEVLRMRQLGHVLRRGNVTALDRSIPESGVRDDHIGLFADHAAEAMRQEAELCGVEPLTDERDRLAELDQLQSLADRSRVGYAAHALQVTIHEGCRIVGTPYDVDWSLNGGWGFFSRYDGEVVVLGLEGESAAGVGLYLSSDDEVDVSITPLGAYSWNWFSAMDAPRWRSIGGLGLVVFDAGNPTPVLTRRVTLWSFVGAHSLSGNTGKGNIADASNPAVPGSFGASPLAPVVARLRPGRQLLCWVWGWQISRNVEGTGSLAFLKVQMPAVQICSGPPLIIR